MEGGGWGKVRVVSRARERECARAMRAASWEVR